MAYNELTTTMYRQYGTNDGVDVNLDRKSIYGTKDEKWTGWTNIHRISDTPWQSGSSSQKSMGSAGGSAGGGFVKIKCEALNVTTGESVKKDSMKELAPIVGCESTTVLKAVKKKSLVNRQWVIWREGMPMTLNEILDIVDRYERISKKKLPVHESVMKMQ